MGALGLRHAGARTARVFDLREVPRIGFEVGNGDDGN